MRNAAGHRTPGTARAPKRDTHPESGGGGGRSMTPGRFPLGIAAALVAVTALVGSLVVTGGDAQAQSAVPAAPSGLSTSSVSHDAVSLAWDDPADAAITGYQVLRRSRDGDAYGDGRGAAEFVAVIADTASPAASYTDTTVTARTRYVYRVKAINPAGLGARSSYLNVETPDAPTTPTAQTAPARPTGLSASPVSYDAVSLTWDDPGDTTITGYEVLRRSRDADAYGDGRGAAEFVAVVADTASPATSYTDTTVTARTRYVYRVVAANAAGSSPRSSYVNVETPAAPQNSELETTTTEPPEPELVATAVVVEPPADEPPTAQQQSEQVSTETIWSATMTVGRVTVSESDFSDVTYLHGYSSSGNFGSLDDTTFDYAGDSYTVRRLNTWHSEDRSYSDFRPGHPRVLINSFVLSGAALTFVIDDHSNTNLSDVVLHVGDRSYPLDENSASDAGPIGGVRVRIIQWSIPPGHALSNGATVTVRLTRQISEPDGEILGLGPDFLPVSARLTVGDAWVDQTYPNVCGGLDRFTCRLPDPRSQWFLVRLQDNRRYVVEVDTEANNHRPRLNHVAPTWATDSRIRSSGDRVGGTHTAITGMLTVETFAGVRIWRGGDYLVRVSHTGYSVNDPDYRIRIREQQ